MTNEEQNQWSRARALRWGFLALCVPALMGVRACERVEVGEACDGGVCDGDSGGDDDICEYGGERHAVGDDFPSTDGCNECSCLADGQVACTERACAPTDTCGGIAGLTCADGEYCDFAPAARCGAGDQTGTCEPRPDACDEIYQPVCGCDGEDYGNACAAAAAGVSVASDGACDAGDVGCEYGGVRYAAGDSFPSSDGCNECSCGADGNVACTERACEQRSCGGFAGLTCDAGEICVYPDATCEWADHLGVCKPQPDGCTLQYDPVCGCDGMTYGNRCAAEAAGVTVRGVGECGAGQPGTACGGLLGEQCNDGLFCDYPVGTMCGSGDQQGLCRLPPAVCTDEVDPVCGCDGKTYGNACEAAAAGVAVLDPAACP